ncbi:MAG: septum formation inhibitor Maf [Rhodanobacter sp.]|nr:MAG: septum formation inhibitor Maf [Rhodanobacter sp.]TAM14664.1 MAG: septum formation inhibitor Maf [Rhodanobacter sp.]TAM37456.1 MAG: septum formation inhibitor Maf [Rhodanobacter sp.]
MNTPTPPRVLLASTSRYRAESLRRLLADFEQAKPDVDEIPLEGESPAARAERLAIAKAVAGAVGQANTLVIGSDQVAALDGNLLHKPGSVARACAQLAACSGRVVVFHTAVCLVDTHSGHQAAAVDHTQVRFRTLSAVEIERYVAREQPLDCAGSFKCEGLGISLFERVDSSDPTALIGLPLIALAQLLRAAGVPLP